jgi:hypothetical protein
MAKNYGAADQIEDPSSLDAIVFRAFDVQIVYSAGRDVFAFSTGLGPNAPRLDRPARMGDAEPSRLRTRKLRLLRPTGEVKTLYGEVAVSGLAYPDFSGALDDFMDAVAQARAGEDIPDEKFADPPDLPSDHLIWIRG